MIATLRYSLQALIIAALSLTAATSQADPGVDTAYMARLVYAAKRTSSLYPDFYRINPALNDSQLYAVQQQYVALQLKDGDRIAGYKAGFVPRAPLGGVVLASGVLGAGSTISQRNFKLLIVEAELAFRFCSDVTGVVADVATLQKLVCEIAPAFEIADGALADFVEVKNDFQHLRNTLIPLNVAYDHVLLGAPVAADSLDLNTLAVRMSRNGELLGERSLQPAADLWANVLWAVNDYVLGQGYTVAAGQFIIPGNLTGVHVGEAGDYTADFGAAGQLSLKVLP